MSSESESDLCSLHAERFKLFCLNHQEPICVVCRDSVDHNKHRFRPINEASQTHKKEIQKLLKPLQEKLNLFQQVKGKCDETSEHINVQVQNTERQLKDQFEKLHQFLQEEEKIRVAALKEEEQQNSKMVKQKTESLSTEISYLSETIKATEEKLRLSDISFLQSYQEVKRRVQQYPLLDDPQPVPGALIDEAKHLGNLTHNIWTKMKEMVSYSPVVLDPNTAHPELILSEDLTSVRFRQRQKLPDNPERFDQHHCVLGSEGFTSGAHTWDVEVRNYTNWGVGVVKELVLRKGRVQAGCWKVTLQDGKYSFVSPMLADKVLPVTNLQKVRVHLDQDRGKVTFFNLDTNRSFHSFKQAFTSEKIFPYFEILNDTSVKIQPMNISVAEQHQVPLVTSFWD